MSLQRAALLARRVRWGLLTAGVAVSSAVAEEAPSWLSSLGGLRPSFEARGIEVGLDYTAEIFRVAQGGLARGSEVQGLANLRIDRSHATTRRGPSLAFHANFFGTHGDGISALHAGDAGGLSNIDFADSVRLFESWLEWAWPDSGWSLRAGQLALDAEFVAVETAGVFCNSGFGACAAMAANMPVPIFAVAAPGVRLRFARHDGWFVQTALYDGNPAPDFLGDPSPGFVPGDRLNRHGVTWRFAASEGALLIAEAGRAAGEGRVFGWHAGVFFHTDTFSDQRVDAAGRSLSDPAGDGVPRGHRSNCGVYAVGESVVWRGRAAQWRVFARGALVPDERNAINASWELGLAGQGVLPGRPDDVVALGLAGLQWSRAARGAVRDANGFNGTRDPVPDGEQVVELTWRAEFGRGWALQPDLQWIRHPGGSTALDDVVAVGLRTYLSF